MKQETSMKQAARRTQLYEIFTDGSTHLADLFVTFNVFHVMPSNITNIMQRKNKIVQNLG
jgi:hypothetical protein